MGPTNMISGKAVIIVKKWCVCEKENRRKKMRNMWTIKEMA